MRNAVLLTALAALAGCGNLLGLEDGDTPSDVTGDGGPGGDPRDGDDDGGSSGGAGGSSGHGSSGMGSSGMGSSGMGSSGMGSSGSIPDAGSSSGASGSPVFRQISAGRQQTCGVLVDGTVVCTDLPPGWERSSELMGVVRTAPNGPALEGAVAVGVGNGFACILTQSPTRIWCWGNNGDGHVGDGTTSSELVPRAVVDNPATREAVTDWELTGLAPIAVGDGHTCARRAGGLVSCWGNNSYDQLGIDLPAGVGSRNYAAPVVGVTGSGTLDGVVQVAVGVASSCALRSDERVYCWGSTFRGALGDGTDGAERHVPAPVLTAAGTPLTGVIQISAAGRHGCAVTRTGHLYCWGSNTDKELGVFVEGQSPSKSLYAAQVMVSPSGPALPRIVGVSAGARHTCAVESDGELWCWGSNATSQLGNGSALNDAFANPAQVQTATSPPTSLGNVLSVSSSHYHSAALDRDGNLFTWGDRGLGRDQSSTTVALPVVELRP